MTMPPYPESNGVHRWVVIPLLALLLAGLAIFVVGMWLEQRDRIAVPGLFLAAAAITGMGVYGLLLVKGTLVVKSYWRSEWEWRHKNEVPVRYWFHLIGWSVCCIGSLGFAVSSFLGVMPAHPSPPTGLNARTERGMLLIVLSPAVLSCICGVVALRNLRPDADYRVGRLLLPRHVTSSGRRWLFASYLFSLAFVVCLFLASLAANCLE